ncbi:MAG: histidine phosphatase family protein [Desulfomonilaceae bacterium]
MNLKKRKFKVYLLRHGEIVSRNSFVGQRDLPLTEEGIRQAYWWNEIFEGVELDKIYCSDLGRTVQTAEILSGKPKEMLKFMPEFREIQLGDWEGLAVAEVAQRFPQEWHERGSCLATFRPPGGESFQDLKERVIPVFQRIVDKARGDTMIVSHAGVNRVILCHLLGAPLDNVFRLKQDYGSLNLIEFDGELFQICAVNMRPGVEGQFRIS